MNLLRKTEIYLAKRFVGHSSTTPLKKSLIMLPECFNNFIDRSSTGKKLILYLEYLGRTSDIWYTKYLSKATFYVLL